MTWRPSWTSALLAVGGGVAWGACFGQETRPLLTWVALAPLILLLERRHGLLWAWLFGSVSWLVAMPWIATTLSSFGGEVITPLVGRGLGTLLAVYLGADVLLFAWLGRLVLRRGESRARWALPGLWVAVEALRGLPFGGFPWNLAAYAWVELPGALELSSWIGATGVSYLVAAVNVAVALAARGESQPNARALNFSSNRGVQTAGDSGIIEVCQRRSGEKGSLVARLDFCHGLLAFSRRRLRGVAITWLVAALALALGGRFAGAEEAPRYGQAVRLLQPNTGIVFDPETAWDDYTKLITLSHRACDEPALLVWPESAAWPHSWHGSRRLQADVEALLERGCPVVLGTSIKTPEGVLNAAVLVDHGGVQPPYAKRRLVPFGEYVPFASVLPFVGNLARQAGDFQAGHDPALLDWGGERLAMAICYEVVFPGPVAEQVRAGATVLVTITNDAWYGDSSAPHQHLRAARFRAAENHRPMLRAALTGISAVIDARGRVVEHLGVADFGDPGAVIRTRVIGRRGLTPFARAPWLPVSVSGILFLFAIIPFPRRSPETAAAAATSTE